MMRRKTWFIAAVVFLLVAGNVAYWRIVAERLRAGYEDWVAAQSSRGWKIRSGAPSEGGWPLSARLDVPDMTLRHAGPAVPGDLDAAAANVTLSVPLFSPANLRISVTGPAHVKVARAQDLVLTSDEDALTVPLAPNGSVPADVRLKGLRIEPATGAWHATVGALDGHVVVPEDAGTDASRPAATFAINASAIALPAVMKWPLGANISSVTLDGALNGPIAEAGDITKMASAWRVGGGSLAISHFAIGWGALNLTAAATLALDDQLQPMGSGSGRIVGYAALLDRLAAAGTLTKSAATAAKAILSLMAGDADDASTVDVPLALQYRTLSMRQVPLMRLPELDWPSQ